MLCRDVMSTDVIMCRQTDTVGWCARLMKDWNIGFLPVTTPENRLVGVVTDRDLALRILAENKKPGAEVESAMSRAVVSCTPDAALGEAEEKMISERKSRIPVVDESGICVGVISLSDIARAEGLRRVGRVFKSVVSREGISHDVARLSGGFE